MGSLSEMTESDRTAKVAAREALQEFMLLLGVDVSKPEGIFELQRDFHHMRSARQSSEAVRGAVRNKVVDVLTGGVATLFIGAVGYYVAHLH